MNVLLDGQETMYSGITGPFAGNYFGSGIQHGDDVKTENPVTVVTGFCIMKTIKRFVSLSYAQPGCACFSGNSNCYAYQVESCIPAMRIQQSTSVT